MDSSPTNNRSVLLRTTAIHSQNTPGCICLWALSSPCCQRFDHLFVCILPFDLPGLVRPARSWSFRQYSSQGRGITQAPPPLQGWWVEATLSETLAIISIAYFAEQGINVPNLSGHINFFGFTPPCLRYKNSLKNTKFLGFFIISKKLW